MLKLWVVAAIVVAGCGASDVETTPDAGSELDAEAADAGAPDASTAPHDAALPANDCRVLCGDVGYRCSPDGWLCNVAAQDIPCELPDACPAE